MTHELGVVFLHHRLCAVTQQNLQSFRASNPDVPIEAVSSGPAFAGELTIQLDLPFASWWSNVASTQGFEGKTHDFLLKWWYPRRKHKCRRWLIAEWDVFCNVDLLNWARPTSNFDVTSAGIVYPNREVWWPWFKVAARVLPAELMPYLTGIYPLACTMISEEALSKILELLPENLAGKVNTEVRIGTLARKLGIWPVANPMAKNHITWRKLQISDICEASLWHPVKEMIPDKEALNHTTGIIDGNL